MPKSGISIDIPGFGARHILSIFTDYNGTLSRGGRLSDGVRQILLKLSALLDVHVLTADTFGMADGQLQGVPIIFHRLNGSQQDVQKQEYGKKVGLQQSAVLGNGNNDRLLLKAAKDAGGLSIAVDKRV